MSIASKGEGKMRRTVVIAVCLSAILLAAGCIYVPSQTEINASNDAALDGRLQMCVNAGMKKSELLMQVGAPTTKEVLDDAEIWIYQITEQGNTISETTYQPGNLFARPTTTTTSNTPQYSAMITIRFNPQGVMTRFITQGSRAALYGSNNRFLRLSPPGR